MSLLETLRTLGDELEADGAAVVRTSELELKKLLGALIYRIDTGNDQLAEEHKQEEQATTTVDPQQQRIKELEGEIANRDAADQKSDTVPGPPTPSPAAPAINADAVTPQDADPSASPAPAQATPPAGGQV